MKKERSLFFDSSLIYFVVIICFVAIRILTSLVQVDAFVSSILSVVIQVGIMGLLPFLMYKKMRKKKAIEVVKDFNIKKISFKAVIIAILIGFIVYFVNMAVASFFNIFINATGYDPSFGMASTNSSGYPLMAFLGDIILTALLPGICEEFCHRGMLLNGCKQLGTKKAIILVSVLFGLMHLNVEQAFYAIVIGAFLTVLVYLTGSIIPSMIVHFMNNFMGLYMTFAMHNKLPLGNFSENLAKALDNSNPILAFMAIIFIVVIVLTILFFLVKWLMKTTRVKEFKQLAQKAIAVKQREDLFNSFDLDVNKIDAENGVQKDQDLPEMTVENNIAPNGQRRLVIDFNFKNKMLFGNVEKVKPTLKEKSFMYGTLALGVLVTIFTLIWGIL
ncbi:MAG: CPBP family intramembrane metalloprotease [Clostridiales bacterium]|nr:CPBP family intramembrane metalloprotease [Clostridiales bacterium]